MADQKQSAGQGAAAASLESAEWLKGEVEAFKKQKGLRDDANPNEPFNKAFQSFLSEMMADENVISDHALETLDKIISKLDGKLSEQINLVLHHPDFQRLEGSWRGLEHMVYGTETSKDLKIKVLNVAKSELSAQFKRFKGGAWDQSDLFKKIYGPYNTPGGHPYGVLIGDYSFSHGPVDVDIMKGMGQIASASHAPFIAGTDPAIFDLDSFENIEVPRDLEKVFEGPEWASWRGFRQSSDARYVALTMPRFLSRLPYGEDNPVQGFNFTEDCDGRDHSKYAWSNAAYAMGANITQAFKYYGWCSCIRGKNSGGEVSGLKVHTYQSGGATLMKCPTEVAIGDRREHELSRLGFAAMQHWQNTDTAAFMSAPSVYQHKEYEDADATANSRLNGALPYLFAVCRFSHFLKVMVREAIGQFTSREQMSTSLNNWIAQYKCGVPNPTQEQAARQPLQDAEVVVEEIPGQPGYYSATFYVTPIYQLEGLKTSMRLVVKKPSVKAAGG